MQFFFELFLNDFDFSLNIFVRGWPLKKSPNKNYTLSVETDQPKCVEVPQMCKYKRYAG